VLEERHGGFFRLRVDRDINLAAIFELLERSKVSMHIYDYSVSINSLDCIFNKLISANVAAMTSSPFSCELQRR